MISSLQGGTVKSFLTKDGAYAFFGDPDSRYNGTAIPYGDAMYLFLHDIDVDLIKKTVVHPNLLTRVYDSSRESIAWSSVPNVLIHSLSTPKLFSPTLDFRHIYDTRVWGRYYNIFKEKNLTFVQFNKRNDERDFNTLGEYEMWMAVKTNGEITEEQRWIESYFLADEIRQSRPYSRYLFIPFSIKATRTFFSFGFSKDQVKSNLLKADSRFAEHSNNSHSTVSGNPDFLNLTSPNPTFQYPASSTPIFQDPTSSNSTSPNPSFPNPASINPIYDSLNHVQNHASTNHPKAYFTIKMPSRSRSSKELFWSYHALRQLVDHNGFYAGLPWFFQHWTRDSMVSLKAFMLMGDFSLPLDQLTKFTSLVQLNGRLPIYSGNSSSTFDGLGWLWKRWEDLLDLNPVILSPHQKEMLLIKLTDQIESVIDSQCRNNLVWSAHKETWMDTDVVGDAREGFCIENQALLQSMFRFYEKLTGIKHPSQAGFLLAVQAFVKPVVTAQSPQVKGLQFAPHSGNMIHDELSTDIIRPNIFIASYLSPELFSQQEWEETFHIALQKLWLDWGGFSTIDRTSPLFHAFSTGEDHSSYHHGDSWFWVNNCAAIAMHRLNHWKYSSYIKKICDASAKELLTMGALGCHAELSSAAELRSEGCLSQAWSNAMLVELLTELKHGNKTLSSPLIKAHNC